MDARSPWNFEAEHAVGAVNVPLFVDVAGREFWDTLKKWVVRIGFNMRATGISCSGFVACSAWPAVVMRQRAGCHALKTAAAFLPCAFMHVSQHVCRLAAPFTHSICCPICISKLPAGCNVCPATVRRDQPTMNGEAMPCVLVNLWL